MVPKGTLIEECGKMLAKGPPKRDKHGNVVKDKSGKVVHEPYVIKVLNTINFSKSLHYNPFAYLKSEKDILKLVTVIIANTKGEGEKATEVVLCQEKVQVKCAQFPRSCRPGQPARAATDSAIVVRYSASY